MSDSWWDESSPEELGDADTVTFEPARLPGLLHRLRHGRAGRRWIVAVVAFAVGVAVGAGVVDVLKSKPVPTATPQIPTTTRLIPNPVTTPIHVAPHFPLAEPANPTGTYLATCDFQPHSGLGQTGGPSFVASILFANGGNVGMAYEVTTIWHLPDGHDVTRTIEREVPPGLSLRARIVVPAPSQQVAGSGIVAAGRTCTTQVSLLSIFGASYR